MSCSLSVVMPVHNEALSLPKTIEALVTGIEESGFDAEVVLVDDGSTDGSAGVARAALHGRLPLTVVRQKTRGRFEARRAGLETARGEFVLLLDGRVRIESGSLAFVRPRVANGQRVWASHVHVLDEGKPLGVFWRLLAELAWSDYFDDPRTTSFGLDNFDRFPKGTGCLLAPRDLLISATNAFRSRFSDTRNANDDTLLLRWMAQRTRIHVSPHYASSYLPRTEVLPFLRHAYHRGVVFVDGHGRRESRFFPVVLGFYPLSLVWAMSAARRVSIVPATLFAAGAIAGTYALARGRRPEEVASLVVTVPLYGVAHGAGMWRGLMMLARNVSRQKHRNSQLLPAACAQPSRRPPATSASTREGST